MRVRFHTDLSGDPHIYGHNVRESEVLEALERPLETIEGRDDSLVSIGLTRSGRMLKVIYADARDGDGIFVITAYDIPEKQRRALKRRQKRRRR
jgi:hypothetical protein